MFIFCCYSGTRITEAIELEIKDISFEEKWAVINATKTDNFRGVPLHRAVVGVLREYIGKRESGAVFLTQRGVAYATKRNAAGMTEGGGYFKKAWGTALTTAGLEGFTPYSMRHSLNNWLILQGIDQATREALMGHDNQSTNSLYSDVPQGHLIEMINKIPDFTDFSRLIRNIHGSFSIDSARIGIEKLDK